MIVTDKFIPKNNDVKSIYKVEKKHNIKFVDRVTVTSSKYDVDREVSYKNRNGEEFVKK